MLKLCVPNDVQVVEDKMVKEIRKLRGKVAVGIVGGSDLSKQIEQLGPSGKIFGLHFWSTKLPCLLTWYCNFRFCSTKRFRLRV